MATNSWEDLQARIIANAVEDEGFRSGVIEDPKAAIAAKFGVNLPAELDIQVHEDTVTTTHLVLPATGKLDEAALQFAFGGQRPNDAADADGNQISGDNPMPGSPADRGL